MKGYSPARAFSALRRFRELAHGVYDGAHAQPALRNLPAPGFVKAIDAFHFQLVGEAYLGPVAPEAFAKRACHLVHEVAAAAPRSQDAAPPRFFIEKTPHNLLYADLLSQFAPDIGFVHVMRDPRAVAASLRVQDWGPNTLPECAAWVSRYFAAFEKMKLRLSENVELLEIKLEDLTSFPEKHLEAVRKTTGLDIALEDFVNTLDTKIIAKWSSELTPQEYDELTQSLRKELLRYGYHAD